VIAVPVLSRRWDEICKPVEKLKRRQFDHAVGFQPSSSRRVGITGQAGQSPEQSLDLDQKDPRESCDGLREVGEESWQSPA
jgi:hypothetical protein